ncbi:MAG: nucleotidyltransferase domain-containing protein [Anaerolineae bacterium]|nr:nucleotidyltransferase domain-containing protein [Anaerolineae bacterium]
MSKITAGKWAEYREGARRRWAQRQRALAKRRERAMAVARKAAEMLKEEFGATKVVLFGSLARGGPFDMHSDVDLAAWGLDPREYYRVVSLLLDIDPGIEVDLVMGEEVSPSLRSTIEQEGVSL